jgi:tRNA uracil 4-sulfurtransferase
VKLAQEIGTYEDSVKEYKDCCSIVSRHPRTRMNVEAVLEASRTYDFSSLAERVLSEAAVMKLDRGSGGLRVEALEAAPQVGRPPAGR